MDVLTPLGARLRVLPAGDWLIESSGKGVILRLDMRNPEDNRLAEVFLSTDNMADLARELIETRYRLIVNP